LPTGYSGTKEAEASGSKEWRKDMFKKFSSGLLIIILIVLLGIYGAVRFAPSKERTFREKVLTFNPDIITGINIKNPGKPAVELELTGGDWTVNEDGVPSPADSNAVIGILKQLSDLPTKRFAGKGHEVWKKYEVTDSTATLVTLSSGEEEVAKILVGKFSYSMPQDQQQQQYRQQQGDMTTFVRLADEKEVYAVDGFLKMIFNRDASQFKPKIPQSTN
jgi:hypothetical protein